MFEFILNFLKIFKESIFVGKNALRSIFGFRMAYSVLKNHLYGLRVKFSII